MLHPSGETVRIDIVGAVDAGGIDHVEVFPLGAERAEDFGQLRVFVERMFVAWDGPLHGAQIGLRWAAVLAALSLGQFLSRRYDWHARGWERLPSPVQGAALAVLLVLVSTFQTDGAAFLYFQF